MRIFIFLDMRQIAKFTGGVKWIAVFSFLMMQAVEAQKTNCAKIFSENSSFLLENKSQEEIEEIVSKAEKTLENTKDPIMDMLRKKTPTELKEIISKGPEYIEDSQAQNDVSIVSSLIYYGYLTHNLRPSHPVAGVEKLIEKYKDLHNKKSGGTLLNWALYHEHEYYVKSCLKHGCGASDIKANDSKLGYDAIKYGNLKMVKLLHEAGFDFGTIAKDPNNVGEETTYFAIALNRGFIDIAEFLYRNYPDLHPIKNSKGENFSILRLVLFDGSYDKMGALKFLKKIGFDFSKDRDRFGNTGLHHVQHWGWDYSDSYHREVLRFLLNEGVDPFVKNKRGDTVFDVGYDWNKHIIKRFLREQNRAKNFEYVLKFFGFKR